MELKLDTKITFFENTDILSPLVMNTPVNNNIPRLPDPPDIDIFSDNLKELNIYINRFSNGEYCLRNIMISIKNDYNNYRENLLYTLYRKRYMYNIFSSIPMFSEWIKKVDTMNK